MNYGDIYVTTDTILRTRLSDLGVSPVIPCGSYYLKIEPSFTDPTWTLYEIGDIDPVLGAQIDIVHACSIWAETDTGSGLLVDVGGVVIHNSLSIKNPSSKPPSWIAVPIDPTAAMFTAGSKAEVGQLEHIDGNALRTHGQMKLKLSKVVLGGEQLRRVWKAMIAAIPK